MAESTEAILAQAHALVEAGELQRAQETLAPLLDTESDNPALWWVYAHAVTDSQIGLAALDRVLQLDPDYPGARELKAQAQQGAATTLEPLAVPDEPMPEPMLDDTSRIDDWEAIKPDLPPQPADGGSRRLLISIAAIVILAIAAGIYLAWTGVIDISPLTSLFATPTSVPVLIVSDETPDATARAAPAEAQQAPSEAPSATPESSATPTPTATFTPSPTPLPTSTALPAEVAAFIAGLAESVTDFDIDLEASGSRFTQLGNTLVVRVCAAPGDEFSQRLSDVMNALASSAADIPAGIEGLAASLLNCADESASPRVIGVSRAAMDEFASEAIDAKTFQQAWQVLS